MEYSVLPIESFKREQQANDFVRGYLYKEAFNNESERGKLFKELVEYDQRAGVTYRKLNEVSVVFA